MGELFMDAERFNVGQDRFQGVLRGCWLLNSGSSASTVSLNIAVSCSSTSSSWAK